MRVARTRKVAAGVLALVAVHLVPTSTAHAEDDLPIAGQQVTRVPEGTAKDEVVVTVHSVRRAYGATIVYWSSGLKKGADVEEPDMFGAFGTDKGLIDQYSGSQYENVGLVDPEGMKIYAPLKDGGSDLPISSPLSAFSQEPGKVAVTYTALPELPKSVSSVSVHVGGLDFTGVPVQDGPMKPEVGNGDDPVAVGTGWPTVDRDKIRGAAPAKDSIFPIQTNTSSLDGITTERKSADKTSVDLDADVLFAFDKATITSKGKAALKKAAKQLKDAGAKGTVIVGGHTDNQGTPDRNKTLSTQRAEAAAKVLKPMVSSDITLKPEGYGQDQPVASNDNPSGQQANRRVSLQFTPSEAGQ